jgi:hypothetical protein
MAQCADLPALRPFDLFGREVRFEVVLDLLALLVGQPGPAVLYPPQLFE